MPVLRCYGMNKLISSVWVRVFAVAFLSASAFAVVDPNAPSTAQLEVTANTAFNRGQYNTALPVLKKLAGTFKDQPARLGPINEKIRVCEKAIASLANAVVPALAPVAAAPSEAMVAENRRVHPAPKPGALRELTIKELGNFEYDQEHGGNIPADVKRLSGAKVRLNGYMLPMDQADNITQFLLVPSLYGCCIGGQPPQVQHQVMAQCPKGKATNYCPDEIIIEGTLKVEEKKDDGYIVTIFSLDVSSVKAAPK
jgi:hypothetical protein